MKYTIPGFPEEVSDFIELPDIAELLCFTPMFGRISADDLWKHGGETLRYLLRKAPVKNDKKYVSIITYTQLLYPGVASISSMSGDPEMHWHRDGAVDSVNNSDHHIHLLLSDCTALTEFNSEPFEIELDDPNGERFNKIVSRYPIKPRSMEPNRFITFDSHVHRRVEPTGPSFRFMFRITESDRVCHVPYEESIRKDITVSDASQHLTYPNVQIREVAGTVTLFKRPVNGTQSRRGDNPTPEEMRRKGHTQY